MKLGELKIGDKFIYKNKKYTVTKDPAAHFVVLEVPEGETVVDWLNRDLEVEIIERGK